MVENLAEARKVAKFNSLADRLAKTFWPGSLTLVLPLVGKGKSWKILSAGTKTIGVRMSDHNMVTELLKQCKFPITATSANLSGQPNSYSIQEIKKQYAKSKLQPDFYLNAGTLTRRKPSTMVQIDDKHVTLLREGPIKYHQVLKTIHTHVSP